MSENRKVITSFGFILPCRDCGDKITVDGTAFFKVHEIGRSTERKEMTAYWAPDEEPGKHAPIGRSDGKGDTFRCEKCWRIERGL